MIIGIKTSESDHQSTMSKSFMSGFYKQIKKLSSIKLVVALNDKYF